MSTTTPLSLQDWACTTCTYLHTTQNNEHTFLCCKLCGNNRVGSAATACASNPPCAVAVESSSSSSPSSSLTKRGATSNSVNSDSRADKNKKPTTSNKRLRMTRTIGGRIFWNPNDDVSLDEWLESTRPSQLSRMDCEWIQLDNVNASSPEYSCRNDDACKNSLSLFNPSPYRPALKKIEDLIKEKGRVSADAKKECVASLVATAKQQGYTVGKWMVFLSTACAEKLDAQWQSIARATAKGELGCSAKISPSLSSSISSTPAEPAVLCCIYVKDFTCQREVKRVLSVLQNDLHLTVKAGFKPDFYTDLEIYANKNPWRLDPTLYKVTEVQSWTA